MRYIDRASNRRGEAGASVNCGDDDDKLSIIVSLQNNDPPAGDKPHTHTHTRSHTRVNQSIVQF